MAPVALMIFASDKAPAMPLVFFAEATGHQLA
jgi:hypothetical protein